MVSRWRVPLDLYYKVHAGVDAGQARIIAAVEATGGAVGDETLLERIVRDEGTVGRGLAELAADTKYGTTANYTFLENAGIAASIPPHATSALFLNTGADTPGPARRPGNHIPGKSTRIVI